MRAQSGPPVAFLQSNELIIIVVVVILLFGATAIPKLARALGRAKGEFQSAKSEFDAAALQAEQNAAAATRAETAPSDDAATLEPAPATPIPEAKATASEEEVRRAAREVGIQEQGMSLDEVKAELNKLLG